jgi:hypothetical protein
VSGSVSARLAELGIELPSVVPPVAAYVPAKAHGDLVYTAGQLPMMGGALPAVGKVGRGGCRRRPVLRAPVCAQRDRGGRRGGRRVDRLTGV